MPEYRVTWDIDLDADSPRHAAEQALLIQRDRTSTATAFTVTLVDYEAAKEEDAELVDLSEEENDPIPDTPSV